MTISPDLFLAILSMDSYNRGYGRGVKIVTGESKYDRNEIGNKVGIATVVRDANDPEGIAQASGFYALAYTMGLR
jgi:hypothetical protein